MSDPTPKPGYLGQAINTQVLCPHCSQPHTIVPAIVPPEAIAADPGANTRQWALCPTENKNYLVGIGGYQFLAQPSPFTPL